MRSKDVIIGKSYRHKDHPMFCWAKVIQILPAKKGENTTNKILLKCEYSTDKEGVFCLIKYFKLSDLI